MLKKILNQKKEEVETLKKTSLPGCGDIDFPIRDFLGAISSPSRLSLIAEIKYASPSSGTLLQRRDSVSIGKVYETAGAAAISLVTDSRFFKGDINDLMSLKKVVSLPILRKDFIIDEIQIKQSYLNGADAILLIARILSEDQLTELIRACETFGMHSLIEIHGQDDLEKALRSKALIIGINNRDLDTFQIDFSVTSRLIPLMPKHHVIVSESGVKDIQDILFLKRIGVHAALVGTSIMKSRNMFKTARSFVQAGKR